eukprot:TRINITY_DN9959_c0_g1_i1.p1 TRINITY_DN9959_c0_g1~~TRINITY_DN9959_c0_g1_i1.p1  ORF type:complete len:575 (+),score=184.58 TRINITY_DN9959_c0_g1_i1:66-1727(+)
MPRGFLTVLVSAPMTFADLAATKGIPFTSGKGFYKVQKSESISSAKQMVAVNHGSGVVIRGAAEVRSKLELGTGTITVSPSALAGWDLFVQSTSPNRKLTAGSVALILTGGPLGLDGSGGVSAPEPAPAAAPKRKATDSPRPAKKARTEPAEPEAEPAAAPAAAAPAKTFAIPAGSVGKWASIPGSEPKNAYWKDYGKLPGASKIAGFDMDWTLIRTKSGATFPKNAHDWMLWHDKVPSKLKALQEDGYKICIFTNQGGVLKGKETIGNIQMKIDNIQKALGVPLLAVIACGDDVFRKPRVNGWLFAEAAAGLSGSRPGSLFVGDGAGRVPPHVPKKDFGDTDLKFALNLGVKFQTPEECFLGKPDVYSTTFAFDPRKLGKAVSMPVKPASGQELIIAVGAPGSGKSSLCRLAFPGYTRINRDTLKTQAKCLAACKAALSKGESAVVDNQNKAKSDRAPYIAAAKAAGVPVRAVRINVPKDLCFHLGAYRYMNAKSAEHRKDRVPAMVVHAFFKNVEEPTKAEGFAEVATLTEEHIKLAGSPEDLSLLRSFLV